MPEVAQQNDLYEVRIVGRIEGQETNNVLIFRCASGAGDSDVLLHLITVLINCFTTNLLPVLSSAWTFERVVWKKVGPTLGQEIITVPTGTTVGGGNAAALPSFSSAVISKRSATGGRSHRGRMYIPGIPEAATIGSAFDPSHAFWLGLLGFATCCISNFVPGDPVGTNSWSIGIYSRKLGAANFPFTQAGFTPIRELIPVGQIGTTRSRKVGRGS
jgi:hypothetical protein